MSLTKLVSMFILASLLPGFSAVPGSVDPTLHTVFDPNEPAQAVVIQSDGKFLAFGEFAHVNGSNQSGIVRLRIDGTTDPTFNVGNDFTVNRPYDATIGADGRLLVSVITDSNPPAALLRRATNGSPDATFATVTFDNYTAHALVDSGGRILVFGNFTNIFINGTAFARNFVARLNGNGTMDSSFQPAVIANLEPYIAGVESAVLQPDGKMIFGGFAWTSNSLRKVFRLNVDGSEDTNFVAALGFDPGDGSHSIIHALALQPDGKILVAGGDFMVRLNTDGSRDTNFAYTFTGGVAYQGKLLLQSSGKISFNRNYGVPS